MAAATARIMAGIPAHNMALYHRIAFLVGDPAALIEITRNGECESTLILRDIEMKRAAQHARADRVACPKDYAPEGGLSGDRETATAQAAAELLRQAGVPSVIADRSLPLIFADAVQRAGIAVQCDLDMGVTARREKGPEEIERLQAAQKITEQAMELACGIVAKATPGAGGVLQHEGSPLTSERLRAIIDVWLLQQGYVNPGAIVAGGPVGADCHDLGSGPLRTGEPVIIDIFPQSRATLYNGDCTRTVVQGDISDELLRMHAAVVAAKQAGISAIRAGVTGQQVHEATIAVIKQHGYSIGLPPDEASDSYCAMVHGTGHGVGLEVHEPPLLDFGGPPLVAGDALTVEPGLYCRAIGGVRVEDMVVTTSDGCVNLNRLPEGLDWR